MGEREQSAIGWDDVRVVRAISESGGMPGAAAALGLNQSTVFRRLEQIERVLNVTLFERHRDGYVATPAGEEVLRAAAQMDGVFSAMSLKLAGRDIQPEGEIRVATADSLHMHLLAPRFAQFQARCPGIRLEVVLGNMAINLSRRDADVAIRATDKPPDTLVGRRLSGIAWALYGTEAVAAVDPAIRPWVGLSEAMGPMAVVRHASETIPPARMRLRCNTVLGVAGAITAGAGVGYLPCFVGDALPGIARLGDLEPRFATSLWILTHPDLRRSPRLRVFLDSMAEQIAAARPLLEG